jgi:hypothetical protein
VNPPVEQGSAQSRHEGVARTSGAAACAEQDYYRSSVIRERGARDPSSQQPAHMPRLQFTGTEMDAPAACLSSLQ